MQAETDQVMRLADVLLPGDELFPAASASGNPSGTGKQGPASARQYSA